jgi:hypothetical protein
MSSVTLLKEVKKSFIKYIKWMNTDKNRKTISKNQRDRIRELISFWNGDLHNKALEDLNELKELHVHVNGDLKNNEYWMSYIKKIMALRCTMMMERTRKQKSIPQTGEDLGIVWDDIQNEYESADQEREAVKMFISKNPYPPREDILGLIPLQQYAEYGELNHIWCKEIYENITDRKHITKYLKLIYTRGGHQAVIANYYTLCNHTPLMGKQITKHFAIAIQYSFSDATDGEMD